MSLDAIRDETGVPGAVVHAEEVDGVLIEYNGAGSVVSRVYPYGISEPAEGLADRVTRLTEELREAKAALRAERKR